VFKINSRDIKEFEEHLKTFAAKAYPFATKSTINSAAFNTQKLYKDNINKKLTTRNRFTAQSVRVEQSRTLRVSQQMAIVGSIADYMDDQEFGGIKAKTGKKGVSITTGYAAGQQGQEPRTRLARKPNAMANIQLKNRRNRGKNRKQRNLIAVRVAASSSQKYIYMDLGRRRGIFKVIGGKRRPKVKMIHDLSKQTVRIPRTPLLGPAVDETEVLIPKFYEKALRFQLQRHNLFK